jgi:EmrB/QacA subfamily drug resistance transporter
VRETDEFTTVDAPGADEVGVVPWPLLFRRRIAARVEASERYQWWIAITVLAGLFAVGFTITILSVSLRTIADDIGSDEATMTWVITGPLLAFGVLGPVLGKAVDVYGAKRIYVFGMIGAAVFALLTTLAWDASSLIAFRVLGAAEGAATGPASMAMIMRATPAGDRVKAMGYWSLVGAGAPVLGVVAGGPVVENLSWRWIFAVQAPLLLLVAGIALAVLPETERGSREPLDIGGAAALAAGITSVLFALNRGPVWGWDSSGVLLAFALAPVALAAFVAIERRVAHPLIDLSYLGRRNFTLPIVTGCLSNFAYMGSFIITPLLLKEAFGFGETRIGLLSISRPLLFSIAAPLAGYATVKVGERSAAVSGTALIAVAMVLMAGLAPETSSDFMIVASLGLAGIGMGMSSPAMAASVANAVPERDIGIAGAAQQLIVQVGLVAGIQIAQTVQAATEASAGLVESFGRAYLVLAAAAGIAVVAAAFVRSTDRSPPDD